MTLPRFLIALLWSFLPFASLLAVTVDRPIRPNILVIFSDDHGWTDLGIHGVDPNVKTPQLDQMAKDGVLFQRGYVTAPQCTPSRCGLLTGAYQNRFGVEHNGISLRSDVITLPERLQKVGYVTGMAGKWHLDIEQQKGAKDKAHKVNPLLAPQHQGFQEFFNGSMHDYQTSFALDGSTHSVIPQPLKDPRCRAVIQTEAALAFLKRRQTQNNAQPWFLYLAYMAPHVPMESAEPWFSQTPKELPKERRQALSLIGAIDDGVGRIRKQLNLMGQAENTLIFFIGDNGAPLGNSWNGSQNLPQRGQKGMLSEGGIRVPFLCCWPSKIPAGQVYEHPVISLDVAATAIALGDADAKVGPLDGVNLLPHLTGQEAAPPHDTLYWRWMSQAAIQEFPYKLIALGGQGNLLFDIRTSEGEHADKNLIKQHPDIAARLEQKLKTWTGTLQPPGMPPPISDHHVQLFNEHKISNLGGKSIEATAEKEGTIQNWLCRNGSLTVNDHALVIKPDREGGNKGRTFITTTDVNLPGPVTVTLRLRSVRGGKALLTWRTPSESFTARQVAEFEWPTGNDWRDVTVPLAVEGRLIHLRVTIPNQGEQTEVGSIEIHGAQAGESKRWDFKK